MGVSIRYWAIPPSSALFRRLESEEAFITLTSALCAYGGGFFFFDDIDPDEREQILEWVMDNYQSTLGAEPEARRFLDEFRLELERTRLAYPGVEHRQCSLEKTSFLVEERLSEALKLIRGDATEFVRRLVRGDQVLLGRLSLISAQLVQEGARVLSQVDASHAFANDRVWQFEDFQRWRQLYEDAAVKEEALLVGVC